MKVRNVFRSSNFIRFAFVFLVLACVGIGLAILAEPAVMKEKSLVAVKPEARTLFSASGQRSQDGIWEYIEERAVGGRGPREIVPEAYRTLRLDKDALTGKLREAPLEFTPAARKKTVTITLPFPDGTFGRFRIEESPIMEPGLARQFPEIKTYRGQGIDDPTATARFDTTPTGFHAQVLSAQESVYIDPYSNDETSTYISYYKGELRKNSSFACIVGASEGGASLDLRSAQAAVPPNGDTLRNYRLALAASGEYTVAAGGTVPLAIARMVTTLTRVNGIYEREVAIRMTLVTGNDGLIYTNPATDPYTGTDVALMFNENQTNVDAVIGNANYDIGHVFHNSGGGIAAVKSTCKPADKGRGATGLPSPFGDPFDVDYVAHEMGHQHGAIHTFNTSAGGCGGFRNPISAYEPGSGSTPMSYVGTCPSADLQRNADDYFHIRSLNEIFTHMTGAGNCAAQTATGNTAPAVDAGPNYSIPRNTPFMLTASGGDPNGDELSFTWEEFDLGPISPPESDSDGMLRPIFRSYRPSTNPSRTFPSLQYILDNANVPPGTYDCGLAMPCITGESLPNVARTMNFQVTARDGRAGGGGVVSDSADISVTAAAGPFLVTQPNTGVNWTQGTLQTVLWEVAGTTAAPVSAATVNIRLSVDGGNSFPITLASGTPNDGTETVTIPNYATTRARIKVEAAGNIFFDIGNANFTVTGTNRTQYDFDGDGKSDISVFRPGEATWYVRRSSDSGFRSVKWGLATDRIAPADYDGDGKSDIAVWRSGAPAFFYIIQSSDSTFRFEQFGQTGDEPDVAGDWDGDAKADPAVYRMSAPGGQSFFYFRGSLDNPGGGITFLPWGTSGDRGLRGDFDGDGKQDAAIFRATDRRWYVLQTSTGALSVRAWGAAGDMLVPRDYDADGKTDLAVFRSSDTTWYISRSTTGTLQTFKWGLSDDMLVPADYDGDGKADFAVYRNGTWFIQQSLSGTTRFEYFGLDGDLPVPSF